MGVNGVITGYYKKSVAVGFLCLLAILPSALLKANCAYDSLFNQLYVIEDDQALDAFILLTQCDAAATIDYLTQHNDPRLTLNRNPALPLYFSSFLEQLLYFTSFCKKQQINYWPNDSVKTQLNQLKVRIPFYWRYQYENALLQQLTLEDITAVEYWAILFGAPKKDMDGKGDFSSSMARVVDIFYSEHWDELLADNQQLRAYLKKSALFSRLGIQGHCNRYLNKFGHGGKKELAAIENILYNEADPDIRQQAIMILNLERKDLQQAPEDGKHGIKLKAYLEAPASYPPGLEAYVSFEPTAKNYQAISEKIIESTTALQKARLIQLLSHHVHLQMVPAIFEIIEDPTVIFRGDIISNNSQFGEFRQEYRVSVSDVCVALLEHLYHHAFRSTAPVIHTFPLFDQQLLNYSLFYEKSPDVKHWQAWWQQHAEAYPDWGSMFYREQVTALKNGNQHHPNAISRLLNSPHLQPSHLPLVLAAYEKLHPAYTINDVDYGDNQFSEKELPYFYNIPLKPEEVYYVINLFQPVDPNALIQFIRTKTRQFSPFQAGKMYFLLLDKTPLKQWIPNSPYQVTLTREMEKALQEFRKFIHNNTDEAFQVDLYLAWLQYYAFDLNGKLNYVVNDSGPVNNRIIENILTINDYEELGVVLSYLLDLPYPDALKEQFLKDYCGIMVPDGSGRNIHELLYLFGTMDAAQVYAYYLEAAGVHYRRSYGTLDFDVIYHTLKYDWIRQGFVGDVGTVRTAHVKSLIILLELEFELNNGHTGVVFIHNDVQERAQRCIQYLKAKKMIQSPANEPPSMTGFIDG